MRELQTRLPARAYAGPRDGRYGPAAGAIESFERASSMPVTGLATRRSEALPATAVVTGKIDALRPIGARR